MDESGLPGEEGVHSHMRSDFSILHSRPGPTLMLFFGASTSQSNSLSFWDPLWGPITSAVSSSNLMLNVREGKATSIVDTTLGSRAPTLLAMTSRSSSDEATTLPAFITLQYESTVLAFRTEDGLVFAVLYGATSDWVKNVLAAGHAQVKRIGKTREYGEARLVGNESMRLVPAIFRGVFRLFRVRQFLHVTATGN